MYILCEIRKKIVAELGGRYLIRPAAHRECLNRAHFQRMPFHLAKMKLERLAFTLAAASYAFAQTAYYGPQPTPMPCSGDACVDPTYDNLRYQDNTIIRRPGKDGGSDLYFRFSKGDHPGTLDK